MAKYNIGSLFLQIGSSYSVTSGMAGGLVTVLNNWGAYHDISGFQFDFTKGYGLYAPLFKGAWWPDYFVSNFSNSTGSAALPLNFDLSGSSSSLRFNVNDEAELHFTLTNFSIAPATVPVPASMWLFCSGLLSVFSVVRYKHK